MSKRQPQQTLGKRVDNYATAIRQLQTDIKLIKSVINTEVKYKNTSLNGGIGNTLVTFLLNGMVKSTGVSDRIGRSLKATGFELSYHVDADSSVTRSQLIRVMLVLDRFPHAQTFASTDLLEHVSTEGLQNRDNIGRFKIMYDHVHVLCPDGEDAHYTKLKRKINMHVKYDFSNVGNIDDITENALYVCAISNSAATPPNLDGEARFLFVDN